MVLYDGLWTRGDREEVKGLKELGCAIGHMRLASRKEVHRLSRRGQEDKGDQGEEGDTQSAGKATLLKNDNETQCYECPITF